MTQAPAEAAVAFVRLSVVSGSKRIDAAVPAGIPVAEVLPEVVRALGLLNPATATAGPQLVRDDGTVLDTQRSLTAQSIADGAILGLDMTGGYTEPKVYDDVVEAVADLVETEFAPWTKEHSARTAIAASGAFLLAGLIALWASRDQGALVGGGAAAGAVLIVGVAWLLANVRRLTLAGTVLSAIAPLYAFVAPYAFMSGSQPWSEPLMLGGAAAAIVAGVAAVVVDCRRFVPGGIAFAGLIVALAGFVRMLMAASVPHSALVLLTVSVIVGNLVPWLGIWLVRLDAKAPRTEAEVQADIPAPRAAVVREQVRTGHQIAVAINVGTGIAAVLAGAVAVRSGILGLIVSVLGFGAVLLRTRSHRTMSEVLVAMLTGTVGIAVVCVAASLTSSAWRPWIALGLGVATAGIIGVALVSSRTSIRLGRLADVIEGALLIALIPLTLWGIGLIG